MAGVHGSAQDQSVGDLCREVGVTRQTLYRHVGPDGSLRHDGEKLDVWGLESSAPWRTPIA
jgi:hypothetical protein